MPHMNGLEDERATIARLSRARRQAAIIALTAHAMKGDKDCLKRLWTTILRNPLTHASCFRRIRQRSFGRRARRSL